MRLTIERGNDPIIKSTVYILSVGIQKYHYEKLADILYRIAVIFEPPQEITKPKRIINVPKKLKKFPLGDAILSILKGAVEPMAVGDFIPSVPRKFSLSIWGAVLGKLEKRGKIISVPLPNGRKLYKLSDKEAK